MPSFAYPWALLVVILLLPALWWWRQRGQGRLLFSHFSPSMVLPPGRTRRVRRLGWWLRALGMLCLIVALAGPRWPDLATRIPTQGIAIAMVVDASGSMAKEDFHWQDNRVSRLAAVQRVFRLFVKGGEAPEGVRFEGRPADLIGLVVYANTPHVACPLTLDHETLLQIADTQQPQTLAVEGLSNPGDALAWALYHLEKAPVKRKVIVFLSDGESNVPPPALKPRQAAQLAGNLEIPIYAIDAGQEEEGKPAKDAQSILADIAQVSKGMHFQARDSQALLNAIREIDKLERQEVLTFHFRRYHEGFAWFALAALGCLASIHLLEATVWRRVP